MTRRTRIPNDFTVSAHVLDMAARHGWPDPRNYLEKFIFHHKAHGSLMADWDAALCLWMTKTVQFAKEKGQTLPKMEVKSKQVEMRLKPRVAETEPTPEQRRENLREFGKLLSPLIKKFDVRKEHDELK